MRYWVAGVLGVLLLAALVVVPSTIWAAQKDSCWQKGGSLQGFGRCYILGEYDKDKGDFERRIEAP